MTSRLCRNSLRLIALLICALPIAVHAAEITYTVDPTQSSLTLSGDWGLSPIAPQPGNGNTLTTSLVGTISADRDTVDDTLQITGAAIAAQNGGSYNPAGPAAFGFGESFPVAITDFSFSLSGSLVTSPESFDASELGEVITSGDLEYYSEIPSGQGISVEVMSVSFAQSSLEPASGDGTLNDEGGTETLTIPIDIEFTVGVGFTSNMYLSGEVVATTLLPEPRWLGIAALPVLLACRRRSGKLPSTN